MRYEGSASGRPGHPAEATDRLARGLGYLSLGLGLAELFAGRAIARRLGMEGQTDLIRAYGLREIATGVGILTAEDPAPWIWGRVAGDALDLATLGAGLNAPRARTDAIVGAMGMVLGVTALDAYCARSLDHQTRRPLPPVRSYHDRSGYPRGLQAARGAARDFAPPHGYRSSEPLRPWAA